MLATTMTLHLLAVIVWIGGMFFAHHILRPVTNTLLEPPLRLRLMSQVLGRFFTWVWIAITLLWATGFWVIFNVHGDMAKTPAAVHLMLGIALVMTLIFCYIFFIPYARLQRFLSFQKFPEAGQHLAIIRQLVATNLLFGIATVIIAIAGKYGG